MEIDYNSLAKVIEANKFDAAAIVLPGPPIEIFAQRGAPTVVLKPLGQNEPGKFYFECKTATAGYMQVGWADEGFTAIPEEGKGCGDDVHSWAYDGKRSLKWHASQNEKYGKTWNPGDVVGIAVDVDKREIMFSLNGDFSGNMGIAFQNISSSGAIYPCLSLARGERLQIHLGYEADPFYYQPPEGFIPLRLTSLPDTSSNPDKYSKFSSFTNVIEMGLSESSFITSFPGEIMVNVMGRGLSYEAKKNAIVHGGYEETLRKWKELETSVASSVKEIGLSLDEIYAVVCYTLEKPPVYRFFNSDTRIGYQGGGMDFPIITYLLREACRKILAVTPREKRTQTVYRGVSVPFSANVGQVVRFGSYTSTTGDITVAQKFQESCQGTQFVIATKIGASIKILSAFPEEDEVLLPPYEVYRVNRVEDSPSKIYLASVFKDDFVDNYVVNGNAVYGADGIAKNG